MPITLIASNSLWNEKDHVALIESWDPIEVHVRFDQPISHELEYVDKDVTLFWVEVAVAGEPVSRLVANKVLPELMDEARSFKNGRFRFSLMKAPDALSQHHHARFAEVMAERAPGRYPVTLTLYTDNAQQAGKALAEASFELALEAGSQDMLRDVAAKSREAGADQLEDAEAKAAKMSALWSHRGSAKPGARGLRVKLAAKSADTRVRLHQGGGRSQVVSVRTNIETDWHEVAEGSEIELVDASDAKVRALLVVSAALDGTTLTVG